MTTLEFINGKRFRRSLSILILEYSAERDVIFTINPDGSTTIFGYPYFIGVHIVLFFRIAGGERFDDCLLLDEL
jgi:hypothetical protein